MYSSLLFSCFLLITFFSIEGQQTTHQLEPLHSSGIFLNVAVMMKCCKIFYTYYLFCDEISQTKTLLMKTMAQLCSTTKTRRKRPMSTVHRCLTLHQMMMMTNNMVLCLPFFFFKLPAFSFINNWWFDGSFDDDLQVHLISLPFAVILFTILGAKPRDTWTKNSDSLRNTFLLHPDPPVWWIFDVLRQKRCH
jgi:hypothetical protein